MDFPRTVYKSPGKIKYNGKLTYDSIIVRDLEEYERCVEEGYSGVFAEAFKTKKTEEKTDWKKLAIDAGLEGEDLKKFMKKSTVNRQKFLDNL